MKRIAAIAMVLVLFASTVLAPIRVNGQGLVEYALILVLTAVHIPSAQSVEFIVRNKTSPSAPDLDKLQTYVIVVTNHSDTSCNMVVKGELDTAGLGGAVATARFLSPTLLEAFGEPEAVPACFANATRASIAFGALLGPDDLNKAARGTSLEGLGPPVAATGFIVRDDGTTEAAGVEPALLLANVAL